MRDFKFMFQFYFFRDKQTLFSSEGILLQFPDILVYLFELQNQTILQGEERDHMRMINELTKDILIVIALMIEGNPENCKKLLRKGLDIFFDLLQNRDFFEGVLKVLHLAVKGSSAVVSLFSDGHSYFEKIFDLLEKFGRNDKVLDLLTALCVHDDIAIRKNQDFISRLLFIPRIIDGLFLKTYSVENVEIYRPDVYIQYQPMSAVYPRWYYEVEVKCHNHYNADPSLSQVRVGWCYAEYFKAKPNIIAYEKDYNSNQVRHITDGIGNDHTSIGFDGQYIWIGGYKYLADEENNEAGNNLGDSFVIGCFYEAYEGKVFFSLNGKVLDCSVKGIAHGEYITPVIGINGALELKVCFGGNFGKFKYYDTYPRTQRWAPFSEARLSNQNTIKMEKWNSPVTCSTNESVGVEIFGDNDNTKKGVELTCPIALEKFKAFTPSQLQEQDVTTPNTADSRKMGHEELRMQFGIAIRGRNLAEFLHDVWNKKCLSVGTQHSLDEFDSETLREFVYFDQLIARKQDDYIKLAQTIIETLLKHDCDFNALEWSIVHKEGRPDKYTPLNYNTRDFETKQLNRCHEALSRQMAETIHNQLCINLIQSGWHYGASRDITYNDNIKLHSSIRPFDTFDQASMESRRLKEFITATIKLIIAFGGDIQTKSDEIESHTHLENNAFDNNSITYRASNHLAVTYKEKGDNRWYFEVEIMSEGEIRVGWATTEAPPNMPLGSTKHSYAFDGHIVPYKCHVTTESFGKTWKKGAVLGCFLDLELGEIMFSMDGTILRSSANLKTAFKNIPKNKYYIPAVTLASEQKVRINFGQDTKSLQAITKTFEQSGVFIPFGQDIVSQIPIFRSQKSNNYTTIGDGSRSLPVKIVSPHSKSNGKNSIKLIFTEKCKPASISLNTGLSPITNHGESYSFTVTVPYPTKESSFPGYIGVTTPQFILMHSQLANNTTVNQLGNDIISLSPSYKLERCVDMVEEEILLDELKSHYFISLQNCISFKTNDNLQIANTNILKVTCMLDFNSNTVQFYIDDELIGKCDMAANELSLYPTVLYAGEADDTIEFDFTPSHKCTPFVHGFTNPLKIDDECYSTSRMKLRISNLYKWSHLEVDRDNFQVKVLETNNEGYYFSPIRRNGQLRKSFSAAYNESDLITSKIDKKRRYSRIYSMEHDIGKLDEDTFEFYTREGKEYPQTLQLPTKTMYILIPEEASLIALMDAYEDNEFIEFYTKTIQLLTAICEKDFENSKEKTLEYIGMEHLLNVLELGANQLIPVTLSLEVYKLHIVLFLEAEFRLKSLTRKESLIEIVVEKSSQIVTVLPCDPTVTDERTSLQEPFFSRVHFSYGSDLLNNLKHLVFTKLEEIILTQLYDCRYLKENNIRECILLPLLLVIKHLVSTEKLERYEYATLMTIIEPQYLNFVSGREEGQTETYPQGLLGIADLEDSIKFEICQILDYLYDLHIRKQVYKTIYFSISLASSLKEEQARKIETLRHSPNSPLGRELRQPPSEQIDYFLDQVIVSDHEDKYYEKSVKMLRKHCELIQRTFDCQVRSDIELGHIVQKTTENLSTQDSIRRADQAKEKPKLRDIVIEGLLKWALKSDESINHLIFNLIRRYMSRVEEFNDMMSRSYVLPVSSYESDTNKKTKPIEIDRKQGPEDADKKPSHSEEILGALGYLRSILSVKLNHFDEIRLTSAIRTLTNAYVLFQYPDSLFILGVYEAVLNVMEHILKECLPKNVRNRLIVKRQSTKLGLLKKMYSFKIIQDTFACCIHFLCSLIRYFPLFSIQSSQSTDIIFAEIDKLIELSFIYVHSSKKGTVLSPLEVVNSLIRQSEKLTLSLKENQIVQILEFLHNTLFKPIGGIGKKWVTNKEMRPRNEDDFVHGLCYLEFLKNAVCSQEKYIETNAKVIVMYFINHKESIDNSLKSFFERQCKTTEAELTFYTNFLDLLGKFIMCSMGTDVQYRSRRILQTPLRVFTYYIPT